MKIIAGRICETLKRTYSTCLFSNWLSKLIREYPSTEYSQLGTSGEYIARKYLLFKSGPCGTNIP